VHTVDLDYADVMAVSPS